ncbi:MAG: hypothetical protein Q4G43_10825 [Mobilicoccus sp.]|nr:hypothetical protein [Mobilicoccus sp.]
MAVFGFILLLLGIGAGAFALWVALSPAATPSTVEAFGNTLAITPLTVFILGAATVLLAVLGLWLMTAAGRSKVRATKERRDLEKRQKEQEKELAETRRKLGERDAAAQRDTTPRDTRVDDRPAPRREERVVDDRPAPRRDERLVADDQPAARRDNGVDDGLGRDRDGGFDRGATTDRPLRDDRGDVR